MNMSTWARRITLALSDVVCWILAVVAITALRFDFRLNQADFTAVLNYLILCIIFQLVIGFFTKQYRNRYWIGSFEEVVALSFLVIVSAFLAIVTVYFLPGHDLSGSIAAASPPLALLLMAGSRSLWRAYKYLVNKNESDPEDILVIGAGLAGEQFIRQLRRESNAPYRVRGIIDDAAAKANLRLSGAKVLGNRERLVDIAQAYDIQTVVYAINAAPNSVLMEYSDICNKAGIKLLRLPPVAKILGGKINLDQIKEVDVADLLGRRQVQTNLSEIAKYVTGKVVMVTGAGGSIGSEIARQVKKLGPKELVLLDRDESALHAMQLELYGTGLLDTPDMALCSIRDKEALRKIFADHRPHVVFHTAALKHLPMLEQYPEEGWKTNVIGSWNLIDLAAEYGTETFVNISTDKAADPTSVLGRTKRLAEQIAAFYAHNTNMRCVSVRFGNVLGSRGSMLWTFKSQIEKGGPLTITHPDVERFFMTIPEACALVIQAGAIGRPGEVMVLDMGEPVKIMDVANRMIAQSGKDIEIVITGLRPGEKLTEVLRGEVEDDNRPFHPLISHVSVPPLDPSELDSVYEATISKDEVLYTETDRLTKDS